MDDKDNEDGYEDNYSGFVNTRVCLGGLRDVIDLKGLGP